MAAAGLAAGDAGHVGTPVFHHGAGGGGFTSQVQPWELKIRPGKAERWKEAHKARSIPARLGTAPGRGAGRRSGGCSVLLSVCSHPATPLGDELRC